MKIRNIVRAHVIGAAALGAWFANPAAFADPVTVNPGDSNVTIPNYTGGTPSYTQLGTPDFQSAIISTSGGPSTTINFVEVAFTSSTIDPYGPNAVSFVVGVMSSSSDSLTLSMPGFTGYATQLETCAFSGLTGSISNCAGTGAGTVSRSGDGSTLTFDSMGLSLVNGTSVYASNVYGIFTNATSFTDPAGEVCVSSDNCFVFATLGPSGPTTSSVPEPASFALLGLGLIGIGFMRRKRAI